LFDGNDPYVSWDGINEKNVFAALKDRATTYFYTTDVRNPNKKRLIVQVKSK
jgi:hypothetical protein